MGYRKNSLTDTVYFPKLTLQGNWLEQLGLGAGTRVKIYCEGNKMIIQPK